MAPRVLVSRDSRRALCARSNQRTGVIAALSSKNSGSCERRRAAAALRARARQRFLRHQLTSPGDPEEHRQDRHLVVARRRRAGLGDLLRVPVALELRLAAREHRELGEVEWVVERSHEQPLGRAVAQYRLGRRAPRLLELVAAPPVGVPHDRHDVVAVLHAPTSARIAPGPSSVLPSFSSFAPTRIAIFPRCLFSCIIWCAFATSSNGSVFQTTGRISPCSISSLAL